MVVKIPRFAFEKFPKTTQALTTQMKSVGEVMSIARTFKESLHKAIRSLEIDSYGFEKMSDDPEVVREELRVPSPRRLWYIADAFRLGMELEEIYSISHVDPWFLQNIKQLTDFESHLAENGLNHETILRAKRHGFSDIEIARILSTEEEEVRNSVSVRELRLLLRWLIPVPPSLKPTHLISIRLSRAKARRFPPTEKRW